MEAIKDLHDFHQAPSFINELLQFLGLKLCGYLDTKQVDTQLPRRASLFNKASGLWFPGGEQHGGKSMHRCPLLQFSTNLL